MKFFFLKDKKLKTQNTIKRMEYESGLGKSNWPTNMSVRLIDKSQIDVLDEIGRGSSSRVFRATLFHQRLKGDDDDYYEQVAVRQLVQRAYESIKELNEKIHFEFR